MKPVVLMVVVTLAIVAAGYMFLFSTAVAPEAPTPQLLTYANDTYGIAFSYPTGYVLSEDKVGTERYVITLIKEEDAVPVVNGEGPTSITIEIHSNVEDPTLSGWLTTPESNFALSDGTYSATIVARADAVHYGWSGLYEGETTAFIHEGNLIAVSVTYMSPSDLIKEAYDTVLSTFTLR